ncbi:MAG: DUF4153 domain-containing protein [candidate division Zixibacteria bacterium]|nr:DUF4153 domain-containing protein [candidate division Zixibacteria bacterium]
MSLFSKFPSFYQLYNDAIETFARFPFTMLSACVSVILGIVLVEMRQDNTSRHTFENMCFASVLGLSLFTALALFAEKQNWRRKFSIILQSFGAVLLFLYYLSLPEKSYEPNLYLVRFALLAVVFHLLVAFLPFLRGYQVNGFWQYNKSLFLRFLTAALYSAVLYLGLILTLSSAEHLFGIDIDEESYFELWIVLAGIVNTWIFLAGVPRNLTELNDNYEYPKGLSVFAQYILLPLVGLYLVILYIYELKIIAQWNWPKGWVSHLVLGFSVVGILSLLLLWPLKDKAENTWIRTFIKRFFLALIPLIAMLFLAVLERISDYGITINRYLVIAMAVGLAVVVFYFVFSRRKDIRTIPIVIASIALISAFGPWSAFSVSENSQLARLDAYLTKYNLPPDSIRASAQPQLSIEDRREMSSITEYLLDWHGAEAFSKWVNYSVLISVDTAYGRSSVKSMTEKLGFEYSSPDNTDTQRRLSLYANKGTAVNIKDFEYLIEMPRYLADPLENVSYGSKLKNGDSCSIKFNLQSGHLSINIITDGVLVDSAYLHLTNQIESLPDLVNLVHVPDEELTFSVAGSGFDAQIIILELSGRFEADSLKIDSFKGYVLLRRR